jgi:hypothetical protein
MGSESWTASPQGDQTARELSARIRQDVQRQVEQARAEARAAQEEARQAAEEARAAMQEEGVVVGVPAPPPPPGIPRITVQRDGRTIVIPGGGEHPQLISTTQGPTPDQIPAIPTEAVVISIAFFVMLAVIAIGLPLARAFARRMDRKAVQPALSPELAEQLMRLEQSVDTIAVEVERISEGQRFSSGLLREMHPIVQRSQLSAPTMGERGANGGGR